MIRNGTVYTGDGSAGVTADVAIRGDRIAAIGAVTGSATFTEPHRYATGVQHVLVNGGPVLLDGEHTGALPGRFVRRARSGDAQPGGRAGG